MVKDRHNMRPPQFKKKEDKPKTEEVKTEENKRVAPPSRRPAFARKTKKLSKDDLKKQIEQKKNEAEAKKLEEERRKKIEQEEREQKEQEKLKREAEQQRLLEIEKEKVEESLRQFRAAEIKEREVFDVEKYKQSKEVKKYEGIYKAPILVIMGHVDTGKTKILDKLRQSNVQEGEAGGITQQIGATFFPIHNLVNQYGISEEIDLPGLLFIDTPGHETFTNLRRRGSSICNLAIVVVDIFHLLENQTIESIELIRNRKTFFIVALNKIDRIYGWEKKSDDFLENLSLQKKSVQMDFKTRLDNVILKFAELGINVKLFSENFNYKKFVPIVPTSAISGEGLKELLENIFKICNKSSSLVFKEKVEATVLELKNTTGFGLSIDAIISNGQLREGDKICLTSINGPIVRTVKNILLPEPLKEMRVKHEYKKVPEVKGALGIKIIANQLDEVLPGSRLIKVETEEEEMAARKEIQEELKSLFNNIQVSTEGVHINASTLGSLEALIAYIKEKNIKVSSIGIGKINKKILLKMKMQREWKQEYGAVLLFDQKIDKDMQEIANQYHVKMFSAQTIYNLIENYEKYVEELRNEMKAKNKKTCIFPAKMEIIPEFIFNKRSPLIFGVNILAGKLSLNSSIFVEKGKEIVILGKITSIIKNKKNIELAEKGDAVCIKVENENSPKILGRHFDEKDIFYTHLNRENIDTLKNHFSDDMSMDDWKLIMFLKNRLNIL